MNAIPYQIALNEAELALAENTYPIGAVLVINNKLVGKAHNQLSKNEDRISHAEMQLLQQYSPSIKQAQQNEQIITLVTTLEPCLMCLGTIVLHRINRLIYFCPDPVAGATQLTADTFHPWYQTIWPQITHETKYQAEVLSLMIQHLQAKPDGHYYKEESLTKFISLANHPTQPR